MTRSLPIIEARKKLTQLPEHLERHPGTLTVTRRGKPVLAVMHWDLYETIMETMEILGDAELMAQLKQSVKDIEAGRGIPWEQAKRRLQS
jgi:PHD/YefM family antitoxin component YafN of YafNO toxin-antitoxin module